MFPTLALLHIGNVLRPITSYGLMLALACVCGTAISVWRAHRRGMDFGKVIALAGLVIGGAFAGGALVFDVVEIVRGVPFGTAVTEGGRVLFGAYLGGLATVFICARRLSLSASAILDASVPGLALAHALGRVGCFLAGCCYGAPSSLPFAVTFTDASAPASAMHAALHPVQLYDAVLTLFLCTILLFSEKRFAKPGQFFAAYLGAVGAARIILETFRADVVRGVFGAVSTSQILGGLLVLIAATFPFFSESTSAND